MSTTPPPVQPPAQQAFPQDAPGKGLAIAGVAISSVGIIIVPILIAILLPALAHARALAQQAAFTAKVLHLSNAASLYASEHGRLPSPEAWEQQLADYGAAAELVQAPSASESGRAVAMNAALKRAGMDAPEPARTVLFFECRPGAPLAGGRELLPDEPRYPDGYVIVFLDTHVKRVPPEAVDKLMWDPFRTSRHMRRSGRRTKMPPARPRWSE
ncbi:MAG: hypothetical protein KGY99_00640 [Phycisphaerae bacterium]|nr:hypothetical protein [Phycisphaerae bacterium]